MKENDENRKAFRVPDDYFESLDMRLLTKLTGDSKSGMKVPKGYFDDFEVQLPEEGEIQEKSNTHGIVNFRKPEITKVIWMAAAATILLFFGVKYMNPIQSALDWDDLEQAEIGVWIESDMAELNAYDIAEAYPDVELTASTVSSEELNAYLNEIELDQILYEN